MPAWDDMRAFAAGAFADARLFDLSANARFKMHKVAVPGETPRAFAVADETGRMPRWRGPSLRKGPRSALAASKNVASSVRREDENVPSHPRRSGSSAN